jgi:hypothetical protein
MKIRSRLYISALFTIALVVALTVTIWTTSVQISVANDRRESARQIELAASQLVALSSEYMLFPSARIEEQWWSRSDSVTPTIEAMEEETEEEAQLMAAVRGQVSRFSV